MRRAVLGTAAFGWGIGILPLSLLTTLMFLIVIQELSKLLVNQLFELKIKDY